jgi:hypothetical protein
MSLAELLALFPNTPPQNISAADIRTMVTDLWDKITLVEEANADLAQQVEALTHDAGIDLIFGEWMFNLSAPPPAAQQVRVNDTPMDDVTMVEFRLIDADGTDKSLLFAQDITLLRIQDKDEASKWVTFDVTGPAVVGADTAQVPVSFVDDGNPLTAQRVRVLFMVDLP